MEGFVREEDTAGAEPHFNLDGFEGLGMALDQIIPPFVIGNCEDEIWARYLAFVRPMRALDPDTLRLFDDRTVRPSFSLSKVRETCKYGVIGDHRPRPTLALPTTYGPDDDHFSIFSDKSTEDTEIKEIHAMRYSDLLKDSVADVSGPILSYKRRAMSWLTGQRKSMGITF